MQLKVTETIKDYEGKELTENKNPLTWRSVIFTALNTILPDENLSNEAKEKCYLLTKKAFDGEIADYEVAERTFILERIAKVFNPLVYGRAKEFFDKK